MKYVQSTQSTLCLYQVRTAKRFLYFISMFQVIVTIPLLWHGAGAWLLWEITTSVPGIIFNNMS